MVVEVLKKVLKSLPSIHSFYLWLIFLSYFVGYSIDPRTTSDNFAYCGAGMLFMTVLVTIFDLTDWLHSRSKVVRPGGR